MVKSLNCWHWISTRNMFAYFYHWGFLWVVCTSFWSFNYTFNVGIIGIRHFFQVSVLIRPQYIYFFLMAFQHDRTLYSYKLLHGILICFPLKRNKNNSSNKNHPYDAFYVIMQIFFMQDNTKHYFLLLDSSIKLSAFHGLAGNIFFFSIQNIKSHCGVIFLKHFPVT